MLMISFLNPNRLIYALIVFGMSTRLAQYLHNRSLWLDEAALAINIKTRDFAGLLQPLDRNQSAPPAFLLAVKAFYTVFGSSEYVLRLIPLLASLATILLIWYVARRIFPGSAPFALVLFIGSAGFINYASEFKQYASDAAIALALLALAIKVSESYQPRALAVFALAGVAAVWASHTAIFVLAGIGFVFLIDSVWNKRSPLLPIIALGLAWMCSFAAAYLLFYSSSTANSDLNTYWAFAFLSLNPLSIFGALIGLLVFLVGGLEIGWLVIAIIGLGAGLRSLPWRISVLLLSPILFTLMAAVLHLYPFSHRLILFLIPGVLLVVAAGLAFLWQRLYAQQKVLALGLAAVICGLFLMQTYIFDLTEIRDAIEIVRQRAPNETWYGDEYARLVAPYYDVDFVPVEAIEKLTEPVWIVYDDVQAGTTESDMERIGAKVGETIHVTGTTIREYLP
jgi:hypothetical protein